MSPQDKYDGRQLGGSYVTVPPVMRGAPHWAATLDLGGSAAQRNEIGGERLSQLKCQWSFGQARTRHAKDKALLYWTRWWDWHFGKYTVQVTSMLRPYGLPSLFSRMYLLLPDPG